MQCGDWLMLSCPPASPPLNAPIGVRAALTMTMSVIGELLRDWRPVVSLCGKGWQILKAAAGAVQPPGPRGTGVLGRHLDFHALDGIWLRQHILPRVDG